MFRAGDIIDDKYRVEGICNDSGGMGTILFVKPITGEVEYAIVLKYCKETTEEGQKRFCREVRLLGEFDGNTKLVELLDHNLTHEPPYFVMKYYKGGDLTSVQESIKNDYSEQERYFNHMIDCIAELHQRGKFHRDIKPQNFLLDDGRVILTDLGLSKELESKSVATKSSAFWGTQGYLPPEFLTGGFKYIDATSDIFQLGKSFYNLLTGRDPQYLVRDDIPESLFYLIERCCAIDKARRYQDLASLKQSLKAVYDVLLERTDAYGNARLHLISIQEKLEVEKKYDSSQVKAFVEELSSLELQEKERICFELKQPIFHALKQPPLESHLSVFLSVYSEMVKNGNYDFGYAEIIAREMRIIFSELTVSVDNRATALELAVLAAHVQNRFAAMGICKAMVREIDDDNLGLRVRAIIVEYEATFIADIEPSECNCDSVRRALREIRESK